MAKRKGSTEEKKDQTVAVDKVVIVYPGTSDEGRGVVVDPARRWAVRLDDGRLVFVDGDSLTVA